MKLRVILVAMAMLAGTPAVAQLAPGISGESGVRYMEAEETFAAIRQVGTCFVQRRPTASAAFLLTAHNSPQERTAVRSLIGNNTSCAPRNSRMSLPRDMIRGSVAEAMYKQEFTAPPPAEPASPPATGSAASLVGFSRCVVGRNPQDVHNLITTTRLGSRQEHEAVIRLAPQIRDCLPQANNPQLVAPLVRLSLADALYERARLGRAPHSRVQ